MSYLNTLASSSYTHTHAHPHMHTHTPPPTRTHTHTTLAIAANEVDDVRPVLDFYKSRGETNILETFKANQAKLREEEERIRAERERMAHRGTQHTIGGAISTFSLRSFPRSSHKEIGQDASPSPDVCTSRLCVCVSTFITELPPQILQAPQVSSTTINSLPQENASNPESSSWSITNWVGSWIGWK